MVFSQVTDICGANVVGTVFCRAEFYEWGNYLKPFFLEKTALKNMHEFEIDSGLLGLAWRSHWTDCHYYFDKKD